MSRCRARVVGLLVTVAAVGAIVSTGSFAARPAGAASGGGTVQTWGDNSFGQLGNGSTASNSVTPVSVTGLTGVREIAAGDSFDLALLTDGTVQAWGVDDTAELGDGGSDGPDMCSVDVPCSETPAPVSGLSGVVAIATGFQHSLALLSGGTVDAWGDNSLGELGDGTDQGPDVCVSGAPCEETPAPVQTASGPLGGVVAVAAGYFYSLALRSDGTVWGWGLLPGASDDTTTATQVSGLAGVTAIAAGGEHALALLSGGTVMAWGDDTDGELGDGTNNSTTTPVAVNGLSGPVTQIAAGIDVSYALLSNGTVEAWGDNTSGELGDGEDTGPTTCPADASPCALAPQPVPGLSGVAEIDAGGFGPGAGSGEVDYALALRSDGTVESWGANVTGELGNGDSSGTTVLSPAPVAGLAGVTSIAAGGAAALALSGAGPPGGGGSGGSGGSTGGGGGGGGSTGGGGGGGGGGVTGPTAGGSGPTAAQLALRCTSRKLELTDVIRRSDHVVLDGAAAASLEGRTVTILYAGRALKHIAVGSSGLFTTDLPLPAGDGRAGYQAALGRQRSAALDLSRRLVLDPPTDEHGTVTLTGRVVPPLARPVAPVVVDVRRSCTAGKAVGEVRPSADGSFRITVPAPAGERAASYRARTVVPGSAGGGGRHTLFSLPEVVALH